MKSMLVLLNSMFWGSSRKPNGKHFYRSVWLWREDTGLIFHIVGIYVMSSRYVDLVSFEFVMSGADLGRREDVSRVSVEAAMAGEESSQVSKGD